MERKESGSWESTRRPAKRPGLSSSKPSYVTTFNPFYLYLDLAGDYLYMPTDSSSYGIAQIDTWTGTFRFIPGVTGADAAAFSGAALYPRFPISADF